MANTSELTYVSAQRTYLRKATKSSTEKLEVYSKGARGSEFLSSTKWLTHYSKLNYRTTTVSRASDGGGSDDVYLPRVRPDEGVATWQEMSTAVDSVRCQTKIKKIDCLE